MKIDIHITTEPITATGQMPVEFSGSGGAFVEFAGIVRDTENDRTIAGLEYEAYQPMAENELRKILESLAEKYPCLAARVIHRIGIIPAGETAILVGVTGRHRGEAFALLTEFMNRLKQEVPIWKCRAVEGGGEQRIGGVELPRHILSLDAAGAAIIENCRPLPGVRASLNEAGGRVLRETVYAVEDFPGTDRSTRDGYAVGMDDSSEIFRVVDTLHAADWKPRVLNAGEAVRVATGASLPCEHLRVIMKEDVEQTGETIRILERDESANVRRRGEEMKAGEVVLAEGSRLTAGRLALLASVGCAEPLVSPRLKVAHFTTGDEIVSPAEKPGPGQIRDSNSILIRHLLESWRCELHQAHLPEDFKLAKAKVKDQERVVEDANLILISGGASVGEKDFTRALLEHLGFKIIFSRLNVRPGAPLMFGVNGSRIAFGLPGNPLSHLVGYHLFVAAALAGLTGAPPPQWQTGALATELDDASDSRETLWPARSEQRYGRVVLTPLRWRSPGDMTCLAAADALIRIPAQSRDLPAGATVHYLRTMD